MTRHRTRVKSKANVVYSLIPELRRAYESGSSLEPPAGAFGRQRRRMNDGRPLMLALIPKCARSPLKWRRQADRLGRSLVTTQRAPRSNVRAHPDFRANRAGSFSILWDEKNCPSGAEISIKTCPMSARTMNSTTAIGGVSKTWIPAVATSLGAAPFLAAPFGRRNACILFYKTPFKPRHEVRPRLSGPALYPAFKGTSNCKEPEGPLESRPRGAYTRRFQTVGPGPGRQFPDCGAPKVPGESWRHRL